MMKKILPPLLILCTVVAVAFIFVLSFMRNHDAPEITRMRAGAALTEVTEYSAVNVLDPEAPQGKYVEYSFKLGDKIEEDTSLFFFESHQYVRVYLDDELVYQMDNGDNHLGKSCGHMWIDVPLALTDAGRTVRVQLLPVYKNVSSSNLAFYTGRQLDMYHMLMSRDMLAIVLSIIIVLVGILYLAFALQARIQVGKHLESAMNLHVGFFCLLVGVWRITDLSASPMLFYGNTKVLSYLTLSSLYLIPVPMMRILREKIHTKQGWWMDLLTCVGALQAMTFFVLQTFSILDLRELLPVFHIYVVICLAMVFYVSVKEIHHEKNSARRYLSAVVMIMIVLFILYDLVIYYQENYSSMILTMLGVLIYLSVSGAFKSYYMSRAASMDEATGVFNKNHCLKELGKERKQESKDVVLMFDLNHLKKTNDEKGHEVGDRMIQEFSGCLQRSMPPRSFVGRFGGDEFIAIVNDTTEAQIQVYLTDLWSDIDQINQNNPQLEISVAEGHASSEEFPEMTYFDLLEKADVRMYHNKQKCHAKKAE